MDKMKFNDFKKSVNDYIKYVAAGLYTINTVLILIMSIICYFYAISSVINKFNLNNATSGNTKVLSILLVISIFLLILIIASIGTYFIIKTIFNQINNLNKDQIYYYYFGKRWINGLISLILGLATLFAFNKLFMIYIPFFNNVFTILLSVSWFICSIINFIYFFYCMIWFNRQPKEYKEKYITVINQVKTNKNLRNEINKKTEISLEKDYLLENQQENNNKIESNNNEINTQENIEKQKEDTK